MMQFMFRLYTQDGCTAKKLAPPHPTPMVRLLLSFIHSFIHSFLPSFLPSFIHSFLRSFVHSFIGSSVHSHTCSMAFLCRLLQGSLYYQHKHRTIKGESLNFAIHLHCLIPNVCNSMTPVSSIHVLILFAFIHYWSLL